MKRKPPPDETILYKIGVQRDASGKIDTIVLDFGPRKLNRVFMTIDQAEWVIDQLQTILRDQDQ